MEEKHCFEGLTETIWHKEWQSYLLDSVCFLGPISAKRMVAGALGLVQWSYSKHGATRAPKRLNCTGMSFDSKHGGSNFRWI